MTVFTRPVFSPASRIFGLDLLRCLAIILVLVDHALLLLPEFRGKEIIREYSGTIGVELFFSLSGFLIGSILLRVFVSSEKFSSKIRLRFWSRRWLRTLPAFLFYLLLYTIVALITGYEEFGTPEIFSFVQVLFFVQNLLFLHSNYFGISWSLAIEEWFYLLLPVTLSISRFFTLSNKPNFFLRVVLSMIALAFLIRIITFFVLANGSIVESAESYGVNNFLSRMYSGVRKIIVLRLDAASFGVIIGYIYFFHREQLMKKVSKIAAWGVILFFIASYSYYFIIRQNFSFFPFVFTFAFFGIGFSLMLPYALKIKATSFPSWMVRAIQVTSIISYSVYLSHSIFLNLLRHWQPLPDWPSGIIAVLLMLLITYVVSNFSYNVIERWGMRLRKAE